MRYSLLSFTRRFSGVPANTGETLTASSVSPWNQRAMRMRETVQAVTFHPEHSTTPMNAGVHQTAIAKAEEIL